MDRVRKIAELRSLLGGRALYAENEGDGAEFSGQATARDFSRRPLGGRKAQPTHFPAGVLCEVIGNGKSELVFEVLRKSPSLRVAWVESQLTINPVGLFQRGNILNKIIFIEAKTECLWATQQLTASGLFDVVLVGRDEVSLAGCAQVGGNCGKPNPFGRVKWDDKVLRRLQLTAERTRTGLVLLSQQPTTHFAVRLRWNAEEVMPP